MFCTSCLIWEFLEDDVYCSWCSTTLVDIGLHLDSEYVYIGIHDKKINLTIRHTGAIGTIELQRVESRQPWLKVLDQPPAKTLLQSGMQVTVSLSVNTHGLPEDYHEAQIVVVSSIGEREVKLEAVPWPVPQATLGEYTILLDRLAEENTTGYLSLPKGIVTVEELSTDVDWASVELDERVSLPHRLDARGNIPLEFRLKIDEPFLIETLEHSGETPPVIYKGNLIARYAELTPPRKDLFYVKCFLPPELDFQVETNTIRMEIFTGKRGEIDLTLQNGKEREKGGLADLQIHEIKIDKPWLKPSGTLTFPITITSGNHLQVTFVAMADEIGEGSHVAKISFLTNTPGEGRLKEIFVEAVVREMPEFEGVVAIDFGTTNSCCAFLDSHSRLDLISIDELGEGKSTTASSTILYNDLFEENVKDYEIGDRAYEISFDPSAKFSAVRQVKRRLGTLEPYEIIFHRDPGKRAEYLPREVVTDILKRILERAEKALKARVNACTITHPSRFSLRQIEDIKGALADCGIKVDKIKLVHESIGAALDFLQEPEVLEKYNQYTLMVYDFGGGTTDITLLEVVNSQFTQNTKKITPKLLGATGDPLLGGEDVTDIVMKLLHENCEMLLRERYSTNAVIPFDVENFQALHRQTVARQNRNLLRRLAESSKIAVSTYGDNHVERLLSAAEMIVDGHNLKTSLPRTFRLTVIVDNEVKQNEGFEYREVVPSKAEIVNQLRPMLEEFIGLLKDWAKNSGVESPAVILLSGKSSALPLVEEIISEHFKSEIRTTSNSKECVVRGACRLSSRLPRAGVFLNLEHMSLSATTSRLGVAVTEGNTVGKFKEIIGTGVPIGATGIKKQVTDIVLSRDTEIRILENTGANSELFINGEENKHIRPLKVFSLEAKLTDWESHHDKHVSEDALQKAEITLEMMPNLTVKLIARVPGVDEPLEFEAEWA